MLGTLVRAGHLLDLFDSDHPEWGVTDVADALGMPKSSAHDYLASLAHIGLLQRSGESRYQMGWRALFLSRVLLTETPLQEHGRRVMEQLVASSGESVRLAVLVSDQVVYIDRLAGTGPVHLDFDEVEIGLRFAPYCVATGKVLLAHRSWSDTERVVHRLGGLRAYTPTTITSVERLKRELQDVLQQGYAYNFGEADPEIWGVAAPVRDYTGGVIAAIALTGPGERFRAHMEQHRDSIVAAASRLSRRLGYIPPRRSRRQSNGSAP